MKFAYILTIGALFFTVHHAFADELNGVQKTIVIQLDDLDKELDSTKSAEIQIYLPSQKKMVTGPCCGTMSGVRCCGRCCR